MAKKQEIQAWLPVTDYGDHSPMAQLAMERFRGGNMVHAYLLTGAKGLGKLTLAKVLAAALFCTSPQKPCLHCAACTQVLQNNHPDVSYVFPKGDKLIGVDAVRELLKTLSVYSGSGNYRVAIIEPLDRMSPQAQNCLLKSLEEPNGNIIYLLAAHQISAALGTIASRCSQIKLLPRSDASMLSALKQCSFPEERITPILRPCCGNIGMAVERLMQSENGPTDEAYRQTLELRCDGDVLRLATSMKDKKDSAALYLSRLEDAVHRCLLVASGCENPSLLNDLPLSWQKAARASSFSHLNRILSGIHGTQMQLASQVNWQANLEQLLILILEEETQWQTLLV